MSAFAVIVKEKDWENPFATIQWGMDKALLVNGLYIVLSLDRKDRISPFDDDYPVFPVAVAYSESLNDLAFALSDRHHVMNADAIVNLMSENNALRLRIQELTHV